MARSDRHFSVSEAMITNLKGMVKNFMMLKSLATLHFNVFYVLGQADNGFTNAIL